MTNNMADGLVKYWKTVRAREYQIFLDLGSDTSNIFAWCERWVIFLHPWEYESDI